MEQIFTTLTEFKFTSMMGISLYWLPLAICAAGYIKLSVQDYWTDLDNRGRYIRALRSDANQKPFSREACMYIYRPNLTIGKLIGRLLLTVTPLTNLWMATLDTGPKLLSSFFGWIETLFDIPLVPAVDKEALQSAPYLPVAASKGLYRTEDVIIGNI